MCTSRFENIVLSVLNRTRYTKYLNLSRSFVIQFYPLLMDHPFILIVARAYKRDLNNDSCAISERIVDFPHHLFNCPFSFTKSLTVFNFRKSLNIPL